jgi:hypothetical protein
MLAIFAGQILNKDLAIAVSRFGLSPEVAAALHWEND